MLLGVHSWRRARPLRQDRAGRVGFCVYQAAHRRRRDGLLLLAPGEALFAHRAFYELPSVAAGGSLRDACRGRAGRGGAVTKRAPKISVERGHRVYLADGTRPTRTRALDPGMPCVRAVWNLVGGFSSQGPCQRVLVTGTLSWGPRRRDLVTGPFTGTCHGDHVKGDLTTRPFFHKGLLTLSQGSEERRRRGPKTGEGFLLGASSSGSCHGKRAKGDLVAGTS
ncbi:hypothetical protein M885DRAFT_68662 [Pelagophyceae sp. CCMP2097]|nr:hypothetical protein M885DRAFT_68662 [Pelagophyceae sp. CCMP2097]